MNGVLVVRNISNMLNTGEKRKIYTEEKVSKLVL